MNTQETDEFKDQVVKSPFQLGDIFAAPLKKAHKAYLTLFYYNRVGTTGWVATCSVVNYRTGGGSLIPCLISPA